MLSYTRFYAQLYWNVRICTMQYRFCPIMASKRTAIITCRCVQFTHIDVRVRIFIYMSKTKGAIIYSTYRYYSSDTYEYILSWSCIPVCMHECCYFEADIIIIRIILLSLPQATHNIFIVLLEHISKINQHIPYMKHWIH